MSKNVLIFSGSPRKHGNSDLLCDRFLAGAQDSGHRVEKIFLRDRKINYCHACDVCKQNGGTCVQRDDMAEIFGKLLAADVIVMATPVYFYTMDAQMKTLIDRTYAKVSEINNKDMYFIITAADPKRESMDRTVDAFRGFTSCFSGLDEKGIIYGTGAWNKGDIKGSRAMDEAYEMGKNV